MYTLLKVIYVYMNICLFEEARYRANWAIQKYKPDKNDAYTLYNVSLFKTSPVSLQE